MEYNRRVAMEWFAAWRKASKRAGNPFRSEEVQAVLRKHGVNEGG